MDMKPSIRVTLDALARAGMAPGATLPVGIPALSAVQPAGSAPQGALPSRPSAGAADWNDVVAKLNAGRGLQPGPNISGPCAAAGRPPARSRGISTPAELADQVNAAAGLQPGPNVPPGLAADFADNAGETA